MTITLPQGFGLPHIHLDGGRNRDLVERVLGTLSDRGLPTNLHHIVAAAAGPQRTDIPEVYGSHTPGGEREQFEFFSTTLVANRAAAVEAVRFLIGQVTGQTGLVIEAERQIALLASDGRFYEVPLRPALAIGEREAGAPPSPSWPIEMHHGFDVPMSDEPPFTPTQLVTASPDLGLKVGGWFMFELPGRWGYRSNQFFCSTGWKRALRRQNAALHRFLTTHLEQYELWTSAEQVLGVWAT